MNWNEIGSNIAKVAPVLGTVLGGPAGPIVGAAGSLISAFLGVEDTPKAVADAINTPETLLKLKELEQQERQILLQWKKEQLQAALRNVTNARAREVALAKAGHGGAWLTGLVSLVVICGFFWMLQAVLAAETVNQPALLLLGSLGTAFGAVVNYYLGSSLGSFQKNALVEQQGGRSAHGRIK